MKRHTDPLHIIAGSSKVLVDGTDRDLKGVESPVTSSRAAIHNDDERLLAQIGYKQVHSYVAAHGRVLTRSRSSAGSLPDGQLYLMPSLSWACLDQCRLHLVAHSWLVALRLLCGAGL